MRPSSACLLVLLCLLLDAEARQAKLATVEAQLEAAARLQRDMNGTRGDERGAARERTVEAYRSVLRHWPEARAACAEAGFRAGELLRAARRDAEALEAFGQAAARGGRFGTRAVLEIGHVHRRAGRWSQALERYLELAQDDLADAGTRDDASLWAGRVHALEGRTEDARRVWRTLTRTAQDPVDRVDAWDELALTWVEAGDLEAAAGVLEQCRAALAELIPEETERGERVRRRLERMRTIAALERAVAERRKGLVIGNGRTGG
jgi:tetratricopeptide (TPR) repeat protein